MIKEIEKYPKDEIVSNLNELVAKIINDQISPSMLIDELGKLFVETSIRIHNKITKQEAEDKLRMLAKEVHKGMSLQDLFFEISLLRNKVGFAITQE